MLTARAVGVPDLGSDVHRHSLVSAVSDAGGYSLRIPAPRRPATFPVTALPVDHDTTKEQRDAPEHDAAVSQDTHARNVPVSPPRNGAGCVNRLIRRELQAHLLPVHSAVELPKQCSLMRSGWQCCASSAATMRPAWLTIPQWPIAG